MAATKSCAVTVTLSGSPWPLTRPSWESLANIGFGDDQKNWSLLVFGAISLPNPAELEYVKQDKLPKQLPVADAFQLL